MLDLLLATFLIGLCVALGGAIILRPGLGWADLQVRLATSCHVCGEMEHDLLRRKWRCPHGSVTEAEVYLP